MEQKQLIKTARLTGVWYLILAISGLIGFSIRFSTLRISDPKSYKLTEKNTKKGKDLWNIESKIKK